MSKVRMKGLITVRSKSTRLPKKCFLPFGDETILSHVIKRTIWYDIEPIVCTTTSSDDDEIENIARENGIKFFRGSEINKLKRWSDCVKQFGIDTFHSIDADDPFFCGDEMKRSMKLLSSGKYDVICPTSSSSSGGASVGYSLTREVVNKSVQDLPENTDTEMIWHFLEKIPKITMKELPEVNPVIKLRLTLDYIEDYWLLESVRRILGNFVTRKDILEFFISNPDFYKINWFRNEEWKEAQNSKKVKVNKKTI